ncbi:MAG: hypothetical protein K0R51_2752, partial [Cytophagaceae bacterium]|nr:hypothetical protein [Cytophagaceae bacterium]
MYIKNFYKSPVFFGLLIILIAMAVRVTWMGKGAYAFTDETRYEASQYLVDQLLKGNVKEGFSALLKTDARPVDALLHTLPALVQKVMPHRYGINHPHSLVYVQYFHVLIFGLLAFVFYRLTTLLFPQNDYYALLALACFVLIVNNHVHARHILPYDLSLVLLFLALGFIVYAHQQQGLVATQVKVMAGILTALAWLTYPGYYWLPVLMMVYLYLISGSPRYSERWREVIPFLSGGVMVVLVFEVLYRCYGKSLLYSLAGLSLGINQGDYHESLEFLIQYMQESNGAAGWILSYVFLLAGGLSLLILLRARMKVFDPLMVFLGIAFAAWVFHVLLGEVFEFMVFYGRLVHAFVPFMIWAVLAACARLKSLATPAFAVLLALCLFSFWNFDRSYRSIAYPRDVLYLFSSHALPTKAFEPVIELAKDKREKDPYC